MNVYFDKPPSQDAWIDFTLAVPEVFWLLPDEAGQKVSRKLASCLMA